VHHAEHPDFFARGRLDNFELARNLQLPTAPRDTFLRLTDGIVAVDTGQDELAVLLAIDAHGRDHGTDTIARARDVGNLLDETAFRLCRNDDGLRRARDDVVRAAGPHQQ